MIRAVDKTQEDYLRDESRKVGTASTISFPQDEEEVIVILRELNINKEEITLQGARTGITAGAVPYNGHIMNLSRMNKVLGLRYDGAEGQFFLRVEPGVILSEIRNQLNKMSFDTAGWPLESIEALNKMKSLGSYLFTPDPTEVTASIGGMAACNASGACSFKYGSIRKHIEALRVILADGSKLTLRRGIHKAQGRFFKIICENGKALEGKLPSYKIPGVKNASGYYIEDDMELIDLFIGSEGTLGIITEIELGLKKEPEFKWGVTAFFGGEEEAVNYVIEVRESKETAACTGEGVAAVEYFSAEALDLLRRHKAENPEAYEVPDLPHSVNTAIYVELHGKSEEEMYDILFELSDIIGKCGGDEDNTWTAVTTENMDKMRLFRHAVPEVVNMVISERKKLEPELTKLGTDMAVPDEKLKAVIKMYRQDLGELGLQNVMFGHIGNNHIHVNILPENMEEYRMGKKLYEKWAEKVFSMGGTISAEHGIGKLKTTLLEAMYGQKGIKEMKAVKAVFDPDNRLNRGNIFKIINN